MLGPFSEFSVAEGPRPSDSKDSFKAGVDDCFDFLHVAAVVLHATAPYSRTGFIVVSYGRSIKRQQITPRHLGFERAVCLGSTPGLAHLYDMAVPSPVSLCHLFRDTCTQSAHIYNTQTQTISISLTSFHAWSCSPVRHGHAIPSGSVSSLPRCMYVHKVLTYITHKYKQ